MPQGVSNAPATFNHLVKILTALTVRMQKHFSMTYLSIVGRNRVGRTWITTSTIYERCSSAYALIRFMLMHQNVSLVRVRYHSWDASSGSEAFGQILQR